MVDSPALVFMIAMVMGHVMGILVSAIVFGGYYSYKYMNANPVRTNHD